MAMTTHTITSGDGWVEVASDSETSVTLQVRGSAPVYVAAAASAPGATDTGFELHHGQGITRDHLPSGAIYARAVDVATTVEVLAE